MKYMYTLVALISMLMVSGAGLAETTPTLEKIKKSETIYIGYRETEPPMSFLSKDKQPIGYSIDLCSFIVQEVKKELKNPNIAVKYVSVTASNRFESLENNSIDILCGSTTKTLSRTERVDFTQLTFVTGASLLSLKTAKVDGISGLEGKKVAVVKDTTTIDALKNALKKAGSDAKVVTVNSADAGINALIKGDVDAFSSDQIVLMGQMLTHKDAAKFAIADSIFSYEPFALAVRKNDSEFRLFADRVLARIYRGGLISPIYAKWFGGYIKEVPTLLEAMYILNSTPE
ncbi:MAG: amino acid ABC transporter substrate-binding protein [Gammaproteobacteria bacterium]|nr:amino acid ABC transporter substrate-binding protein [Gammaproteobacteria bacterium]